MTSRYTADTVTNCIYGFEANDSVHSKLVEWFSPSLAKNVVNVILSTFPVLSHLYRPSFFPAQLTKWFYDTTFDAIEYRKHTQLKRCDFLNFLLELKEAKNYTDNDVAAFSAIFLFDGFETTSMILSQALFHIAKNVECQTELRAEIVEHFPTHTSIPTADSINKMPYIENIVNGLFVSL